MNAVTGGLGALTPTHVELGVIDGERPHLDDNMPDPRLRLGKLCDDQVIGATRFFENDCTRQLHRELYNFS